MRVIGGPKEGVKMAPENGGTGTTLATSKVFTTGVWYSDGPHRQYRIFGVVWCFSGLFGVFAVRFAVMHALGTIL